MIFEEKDLKAWKEDIKKYYIEKKEKSVEPVIVNKITHKDMKQKEILYHPILQKYHQEEMENKAISREGLATNRIKEKKTDIAKKYDQKYDIITIANKSSLGKSDDQNEKLKKVLLPSNQVDYNIITNEKFNDILFQNYDKLPSKLTKVQQKKVDLDFRKTRDYSIISNNFIQNNEEKAKIAQDIQKKEVHDKFLKKRDYNCVVGEFYDGNKEKNYKEKREEEQKTHGKNFSSRFPPSWKFRETVVMDPSKEVPEEIKIIDLQKKMKKKRFELKYNLEEQYREKDIENQERTKFRIRNKVNVKKYTDDHRKGFDIITLGNLPDYASSIEKYINHKPFTSTWEKLQLTSHNSFLKNKTIQTKLQKNDFEKENVWNQITLEKPIMALENKTGEN